MTYYDKGTFHISDYAVLLILTPQLQNMTQRQQII